MQYFSTRHDVPDLGYLELEATKSFLPTSYPGLVGDEHVFYFDEQRIFAILGTMAKEAEQALYKYNPPTFDFDVPLPESLSSIPSQQMANRMQNVEIEISFMDYDVFDP